MWCRAVVLVGLFALVNGQLIRPLVSLNTEEGSKLLLDSVRADYLNLTIHFATQINGAYCTIASSAMVLNAMALPAPVDEDHVPWTYWNQKNVFNDDNRKVNNETVVSMQGQALGDLGRFLAVFPNVTTKVYYASDSSIKEFRQVVVDVLRSRGDYLLVNYLRSSLGQIGSGHVSPIAAFNEREDSMLILDVARYKYPPVWVSVPDLFASMNTGDSSVSKSRGYLVATYATGYVRGIGPPAAMSDAGVVASVVFAIVSLAMIVAAAWWYRASKKSQMTLKFSPLPQEKAVASIDDKV